MYNKVRMQVKQHDTEVLIGSRGREYLGDVCLTYLDI